MGEETYFKEKRKQKEEEKKSRIIFLFGLVVDLLISSIYFFICYRIVLGEKEILKNIIKTVPVLFLFYYVQAVGWLVLL